MLFGIESREDFSSGFPSDEPPKILVTFFVIVLLAPVPKSEDWKRGAVVDSLPCVCAPNLKLLSAEVVVVIVVSAVLEVTLPGVTPKLKLGMELIVVVVTFACGVPKLTVETEVLGKPKTNLFVGAVTEVETVVTFGVGIPKVNSVGPLVVELVVVVIVVTAVDCVDCVDCGGIPNVKVIVVGGKIIPFPNCFGLDCSKNYPRQRRELN